MSTIAKSVVIKGEVRAHEDLTIEGRIDGPLICEGYAVVLAPTSDVTGDIIARDITVLGRVAGQLVATEVVDIRADARVTGSVIATRLILNEGAQFHGRSEPQHLEAAIRVARWRRRDAGRVGA